MKDLQSFFNYGKGQQITGNPSLLFDVIERIGSYENDGSVAFVNVPELIGSGDSAKAATIYSSALGTLILGKFLLGVLSDVLHIKRTAVIAPLFYAGVFICMALSSQNMVFATILIPLYMIGGAVPSVIPFLITSRNFGDKEYGVMSGWMNMAGNIGQIVGPTIAAIIFDITGTYTLAWIIFAVLMGVVAVLYLVSTFISKKQIEDMGYKPV